MREEIKNYVLYRNQMDMQKLFSNYNTFNNYSNINPTNHYTNDVNNCFNRNYNSNFPASNSSVYTSPWVAEIMEILTRYHPFYTYPIINTKPTQKAGKPLFKPLTKGDDVQFKQFSGLNPNEMSYKNLVDYNMINSFTGQPWPQFQNKIKPVYDGFSTTPTHYSLTPDMKRKMTFTLAERQGFRDYNQF